MLAQSRKETDLIYEGIATKGDILALKNTVKVKETDLIYEGIATLCPPSF